MTPLYIDGCFAMLHPAHGRRGVLICGPLGDEALNSYRALVFLAEMLADAGMPTLRLHYPGTGDSIGSDESPRNPKAWQSSIATAVRWLRAQCGVDAVTIIGLRIGAALSMHPTEPVDSHVLLLPIAGRRFLNELTLAAQITQRVWQTGSRIDDGTWFEAHGLRLDHASRDALKALDIGANAATHALIMDAAAGPATRSIAQRFVAAGIKVTTETHQDLSSILQDSHLANVPRSAFARMVAWISALPNTQPHQPAAAVPSSATLDLGPARETPTTFGSLFGICCAPIQPRAGAPSVLLLNTSANPRSGNARIAVLLARQLAASGMASLRMDASGIGDAAPSTGDLGRPYTEALTDDVLSGVAELRRRFGRPVVVLGICSGAYHALQAGLRDPDIGGLVLINLQRFVWREGDPPDAVRRNALRPTRFYLRHILDARSWRRMFAADFDVLNLIRVLAARLLQRSMAAMDPIIGAIAGTPTHTGRVRAAMRAFNAPVLYVLGNNDPGVEELAAYFGTGGRRLRQQPSVTFRLLNNSDHTLSTHPVRAELMQDVAEWLVSTVPAHQPVAVEMSSMIGPALQPGHAD